jgi:hypothetical protein
MTFNKNIKTQDIINQFMKADIKLFVYRAVMYATEKFLISES